MEAIKKKLASLKEEKETAIERADEAEREKRAAEERAEAVSTSLANMFEGLICGTVNYTAELKWFRKIIYHNFHNQVR